LSEMAAPSQVQLKARKWAFVFEREEWEMYQARGRPINDVLNDTTLSWKAKAMYIAIALNNGMTGKQLKAMSADGLDAIQAGVKELKQSQDIFVQRRHGYDGRQLAGEDTAAVGGHVYVISRADGLCKIGQTRNLAARHVELQRRWGVVTLLVTVPTPNLNNLEGMLHGHFAPKRRAGEWFELDEMDIKYIRGLADG